MFHLAYNMLGAVGRGYEGRVARAEIDQLLPVNLLGGLVDGRELRPEEWMRYIPGTFIPGYYAFKAVKEGLQLIDEGDYVRGMIRLTSAPLVPE